MRFAFREHVGFESHLLRRQLPQAQWLRAFCSPSRDGSDWWYEVNKNVQHISRWWQKFSKEKLKRIPYWEECVMENSGSARSFKWHEALELLQKTEKSIWFLTDIQLPMVGRISLLKQIKQRSFLQLCYSAEWVRWIFICCKRRYFKWCLWLHLLKPIDDNAKVEDSFWVGLHLSL